MTTTDRLLAPGAHFGCGLHIPAQAQMWKGVLQDGLRPIVSTPPLMFVHSPAPSPGSRLVGTSSPPEGPYSWWYQMTPVSGVSEPPFGYGGPDERVAAEQTLVRSAGFYLVSVCVWNNHIYRCLWERAPSAPIGKPWLWDILTTRVWLLEILTTLISLDMGENSGTPRLPTTPLGGGGVIHRNGDVGPVLLQRALPLPLELRCPLLLAAPLPLAPALACGEHTNKKQSKKPGRVEEQTTGSGSHVLLAVQYRSHCGLGRGTQ